VRGCYRGGITPLVLAVILAASAAALGFAQGSLAAAAPSPITAAFQVALPFVSVRHRR
jgi:hypothetical protein